MTEAAAAVCREYRRQYYQQNKEKYKEYRRRYWEKKAAEVAATAKSTDGGKMGSDGS